ncbi:YoaK family protein [Mycobacteriaceae bacterium NPDC060252]
MKKHWVDAYRQIVPGRGHPHGPLQPVLLVLTVVTGLVDAFSYLTLSHVLVANMTGNVVFGGFASAGADGFLWWALLLAVLAFLVGAAFGGVIRRRMGDHRGRHLFVSSVVEWIVIAAAWAVCLVARSPNTGATLATLVVLLGVAMGVQNATARALAVPDLTTTVLTLTIAGIAADASSGHGSRLGRRIVPVIGMFIGALLGAALVVHGHPAAALGTASLMLAAVAVFMAAGVRSSDEWTSAR